MPKKDNKPSFSTKPVNANRSSKLTKKTPVKQKTQKSYIKQTAGSGDICSKDINQLLMGNPPASIGGTDDIEEMWRKTKTKEAAKELDSYAKKGWGNYPGMPPQPDCVIL